MLRVPQTIACKVLQDCGNFHHVLLRTTGWIKAQIRFLEDSTAVELIVTHAMARVSLRRADHRLLLNSILHSPTGTWPSLFRWGENKVRCCQSERMIWISTIRRGYGGGCIRVRDGLCLPTTNKVEDWFTGVIGIDLNWNSFAMTVLDCEKHRYEVSEHFYTNAREAKLAVQESLRPLLAAEGTNPLLVFENPMALRHKGNAIANWRNVLNEALRTAADPEIAANWAFVNPAGTSSGDVPLQIMRITELNRQKAASVAIGWRALFGNGLEKVPDRAWKALTDSSKGRTDEETRPGLRALNQRIERVSCGTPRADVLPSQVPMKLGPSPNRQTATGKKDRTHTSAEVIRESSPQGEDSLPNCKGSQ